MQRSLTVFVLGLALLAGAAALEVEPFLPSSARTVALGGPHAALADDFSLLLANPAGLAKAESEFFAAQLGLRASGPLFDMAHALLGGGDLLPAFSDVLANNDYRLYTGLDVAGPISFGYIGKGIGFGLFNRSRAEVDAAGISNVGILGSEEVLLVGGYAFALELGGGHVVEAGLLAKGYIRGELRERTNALDLSASVMDPMGRPFSLITGIGVDLGLRWAWDAGLSAGLVCRDLYSPALVTSYSSLGDFIADPAAAKTGAESASVSRDLAFGLAYAPRLGRLGSYLDSLVFALDYSDILDLFSLLPRNAILNFGLGLELRVLDILSLRAGIHEALLAAGIGFDLGVFRLNASAWGEELGLEPGSRPLYNLMISLEFRY